MKETIDKLKGEMESLQERADKVHRAIKVLQEVCEHDWKPDGNDSHKDFEKCDICGQTRSI